MTGITEKTMPVFAAGCLGGLINSLAVKEFEGGG